MFIDGVPPAFQFQATYVVPLLFTLPELPREKPSVSKAVKAVGSVDSANVVSDSIAFVAPLTAVSYTHLRAHET